MPLGRRRGRVSLALTDSSRTTTGRNRLTRAQEDAQPVDVEVIQDVSVGRRGDEPRGVEVQECRKERRRKARSRHFGVAAGQAEQHMKKCVEDMVQVRLHSSDQYLISVLE